MSFFTVELHRWGHRWTYYCYIIIIYGSIHGENMRV